MLVVKGKLPDEPCLSTSEVFLRVKHQQLQGMELLSCSSAREGIKYSVQHKILICYFVPKSCSLDPSQKCVTKDRLFFWLTLSVQMSLNVQVFIVLLCTEQKLFRTFFIFIFSMSRLLFFHILPGITGIHFFLLKYTIIYFKKIQQKVLQQ